ncbi:hypothetical protein GQ43DRAFT_477672 [Delitschia confertaspora ATCC 74209]|uniref:Mating-type protein MAT-1 n=1 Tax=Delitschia confertaspora ATCC 74209 TaxID=1513339 RepID=A0A9P4JT65_9PLEO|nr:hypothetical protein GQ43DRAFT_477672 [Delitschia confertaspora ATCC 74209]
MATVTRPRPYLDLAAILTWLCTRTGEQMAQLILSIQNPAAQATFAQMVLGAPSPTPVVLPEWARPRRYILIPVFKPWPMKDLSSVISHLWAEDQSQPLWSLMAKTWSTIRDQLGKENAPLDQFLNIICPYLNIISPTVYLERMGWVLDIRNDGTPYVSRKFIPEPNSFASHVAARTLSVDDLIRYCQSMGYAECYIFDTYPLSSTFIGATPSGCLAACRAASKKNSPRGNNVKRVLEQEPKIQNEMFMAASESGSAPSVLESMISEEEIQFWTNTEHAFIHRMEEATAQYEAVAQIQADAQFAASAQFENDHSDLVDWNGAQL